MGFIVVLNDGTTFTDLLGCKIAWVDDQLIEDDFGEGISEEIIKKSPWSPIREPDVLYPPGSKAEDF